MRKLIFMTFNDSVEEKQLRDLGIYWRNCSLTAQRLYLKLSLAKRQTPFELKSKRFFF